jgi:hypothetical protein
MLEDLGMKGKPTLDKCEAIKKERELKAELDSLDTSLILDTETKGGRATRLRNKSQSRPSYALDDNSTEEEDEEEEAEEKDDEGKSNASKSKKTDSGDDDASDGQEEEEDETSGV